MVLTYKGFSTTGDIDDLIAAVANTLQITTAEAETLIAPYLQGQIDRADLLADIANQLEWIPLRIADVDTALAAVPNLSIPTGAKQVFTLLLENQKRILRIEERELKVWRFVITNMRIE